MILIQSRNSGNQEGMMGVNPIFRSESFGHYYPEMNHNYYTLTEKRQLFLRSYRFSRKQSLPERIKRSLVRVKKVVWLKLRSALRLRRLVCSRLKCSFYYRRRRFVRLVNARKNDLSCFWGEMEETCLQFGLSALAFFSDGVKSESVQHSDRLSVSFSGVNLLRLNH